MCRAEETAANDPLFEFTAKVLRLSCFLRELRQRPLPPSRSENTTAESTRKLEH